MKDHVGHVRVVCAVLRKEKLYARLSKCAFGRNEIAFLGHMVSDEGLRVDPKKTDAIAQFQAPTCRKELLSFLGLAGYYRRFICNIAKLSRPLRALTKHETRWSWGEDQQRSFNALKLALQQAPTLKLPDFTHPFIVTTDASGFCMGGVLSQCINNSDHAIAFYSQHLGPHELKWPAHEKELLAIKTALEKWRPYLHERHFSVYTDNSACKWMLHHPKVSPKMARMLTFFSQFDFVLHHVKGRSNVVADALSRAAVSEDPSSVRSVPPCPVPDLSHVVHECTDACALNSHLLQQHMVLSALMRSIPLEVAHLLLDDVELQGESRPIGFAQKQIHNAAFHVVRAHLSDKVRKPIQQGYHTIKFFQKIWRTQQSKDNFIIDKGLIYVKQDEAMQQICIPYIPEMKTKILYEFHDAATAAHPGVRRTYMKLKQWYYRPKILETVQKYVETCETCARWKSNSQRKKGFMIPIPVPEECWEVVSMDFITMLPVSEGYDAICVVVDKLSKRPIYAPTYTTTDSKDTADLFFDAVARHHGLPKVIISDRDPKFTANFWKSLMNIMGVKLSMTTAHRAQSDGQTERQNLVLEDALRCLVSYSGDNWVKLLETVEYAHATSVNASTKLTPFEIDTGRKVSNLITHEYGGHADLGSHSISEFASKFANDRQNLVRKARENLKQAQERQKKHYDSKRRSVTFKVGDLVLLDAKNLPLRTVNAHVDLKKAKLAAKKVGPFEITSMVNPNVAKLKLPRHMKRLHSSFNIDLLFPYTSNASEFAGRPIPKAAPVILEPDTGEQLHIAKSLLSRRQRNRQKEWLVKWHGFPECNSTWERERSIRHVSHWQQLVQDFRDGQREFKSREMSGR